MTITRKENTNQNTSQATIEPREWVIVCPPCGLDFGGYTDPDEPSFLARIHNDLHHGHRPDAYAVPVDETTLQAATGATTGYLAKYARKATARIGGAA